ncbi:OmpA family protein [Taibaiella koreensis]|uniref:OmpA family protein n=1 Tax=Taibaiella koreensis TaxID=1268548 RepID=UPI000E59EB5E|nr:OmpA family protein [Taibaiella koreensis]
MQRIFLLLLCLLPVTWQRAYAQYFDTLHIHYAIGAQAPDAASRLLLDSLAGHHNGRLLLIYSYADYLGSERANQHLSVERAGRIKAYLLEKGVPKEQIGECTGLGQLPGSGGREGNPDHRRSDIFVRRIKPVAGASDPPRAMPLAGKIKEKQGIVIPAEAEATPKFSAIDLSRVNVNDVIRLQHIGFYPGRPDVLPRSYAEVEHLYQVLSDNPRLKVRLEGHVCCCVYPDGYFEDTPTWQLSVQRAYAIYRHLVDRGIDSTRLSYQGFGRTRPIKDQERTSAEGQVNRRVEVRILEK